MTITITAVNIAERPALLRHVIRSLDHEGLERLAQDLVALGVDDVSAAYDACITVDRIRTDIFCDLFEGELALAQGEVR